MRGDHEHWEVLGLNRGFEAYIRQSRAAVPPIDRHVRNEWLKDMRAEYAARRRARERAATPKGEPPASPATCRELLQRMPLAFRPAAAEGLTAVYEFRVSGEEQFTAHLVIAGGACTYGDGPAERPGLVLRTPAGVWLAIARGELDGQTAFMGGKFTAEGDVALLFKMKALFGKGD